IQGLARQLGTTWNTLWSQVQPVLAQAAGDPSSCHACHGIALHEGNRTRSGGLERAPELLPGTSRSA
ncbi:UNVERIFIED_CONTAM: ISL3 family transposase, partial [Kocuria sp. CPCC 205295]